MHRNEYLISTTQSWKSISVVPRRKVSLFICGTIDYHCFFLWYLIQNIIFLSFVKQKRIKQFNIVKFSFVFVFSSLFYRTCVFETDFSIFLQCAVACTTKTDAGLLKLFVVKKMGSIPKMRSDFPMAGLRLIKNSFETRHCVSSPSTKTKLVGRERERDAFATNKKRTEVFLDDISGPSLDATGLDPR